MRLATSVGWVGGLAVAAGLLVAGGRAIERRRHPPFPPDLRLPFSPLEPLNPPDPPTPPPPPGSGRRHDVLDVSPVPRGGSIDMPRWFGDAAAGPVRIAGKVFSGSPITQVRLAIDVPDPGIWTGRTTTVAPDGSFDFGPMRPGKYLLVASGGPLMSRLTPIDTTRAPADDIELFMYPCRAFEQTFHRGSRSGDVPAAGVNLELAGAVLGTSDASGHVGVCAMKYTELQIRAPGYETIGWFPHSVEYSPASERGMLSPESVSSGVVLDIDGSRAAEVGVQPIWRLWSDTMQYKCVESSVVVTTDAEGQFTFAGRRRLCGIRVFRGTTVYEATYPGEFTQYEGRSPERPTIFPLPLPGRVQLTVRLPGSGTRDFEWIGAPSLADPTGVWIRGHVLQSGAPLPDAKVSAEWATVVLRPRAAAAPLPGAKRSADWPPAILHSRPVTTRTRRDGSFAVFVSMRGLEGRQKMRVHAVGHDVWSSVELAAGESANDLTIALPPDNGGCTGGWGEDLD